MVIHPGMVGLTSHGDPNKNSSIQGLKQKFEQYGTVGYVRSKQNTYRPLIGGIHKFRKMDSQQSNSPGAVKRSSFRYIQPNVVHRRTQLFESPAAEDTEIKEESQERLSSPTENKPAWAAMKPSDMSPKKVRFQPKESTPGRPLPTPKVVTAGSVPASQTVESSQSPKNKSSPQPGNRMSVLAKAKMFGDGEDQVGVSPSKDKPPLTAKPSEGAIRKSINIKPPVKPERTSRPNKPPKPEFPTAAVKERLKSMSFTENMPPSPISPKTVIEHGGHPVYGKVNKPPRKISSTDENVNPEQKMTKHRKSNSCDGVVNLPAGFSAGREPPEMEPPGGEEATEADGATWAPPPKPPRTFAHDEYLKVKALRKKDKKMKRSSCPSPVRESENGHIYEEVGCHKLTLYEPTRSSHQYEEVEDLKRQVEEEAGKGPQSRKPQPPPRPPQPVIKKRPDDPFVRVIKHNSNLSDESFVKNKTFRNPGYMKATHDIIPIKTFVNGSTLKRSKSDECLYAEPSLAVVVHGVDISADPVYQDPVDVVRAQNYITSHGVVVDAEGYALPDTGRHTLNKTGKVRTESKLLYPPVQRQTYT